ncbi:MAG: hypothetical protein LBD31_00110 [Treponema sp.]|jgi:hypothetical protein|nr:hypothetical protein [Treponema sp.]
MPYKQKIRLLTVLACALALVYALALFFDPERSNARRASFTWLPPGARDEADGIEIIRGENRLALSLKNGRWFALLEGALEVPVKQGRVDDLFRILSTRGAFPRRGSSAASHGDLDLGNGAARLLIRGGAGIPLLDLLVGGDDSSGREVFLRKNGENLFRSGDKLIGAYVKGEYSSWYDLKLFEEKSLDQVQRIRVAFSGLEFAPGEEGDPPRAEEYVVVRSGEGWTFEGGPALADKDKVETWIRGILEAQGDDVAPSPEGFNGAGGIRVELGDGTALSVQMGNAGEGGKTPAVAGGRTYAFILSPWTVTRLLRDRGYFL